MACATLKRSLDWESLNQKPAKRHPFDKPGTSSPSSSNSTNNALLIEPTPSPFLDATQPKLTPEKISQSIRDEIRRLHRRRQLRYAANTERMHDSESSGSEMGPDSPRRCDSPPNLLKNPEMAVFTFKQVQMICERMVRDREQALIEQYDTVLNTKLAEQYDAFIKFTCDQIQSRMDAAPSYLS
uniref:CSON004385 protein n=1 Tax=Culicoides sonorensis TaxID=179676 RepID=A0A336LX12_CULSO